MKKLLALLLLAPLAYSEVYTFECKDKKIGTISSLVINTDKKFISVNGGKMHENWQENESKVGAYMYLPGGAFKHKVGTGVGAGDVGVAGLGEGF